LNLINPNSGVITPGLTRYPLSLVFHAHLASHAPGILLASPQPVSHFTRLPGLTPRVI
jgi:hypothetical protein